MAKTELEKKSEATMALALAQQKLPGALGEAMAFATILSKSGVVPVSYAGKPEAVFAIIQTGKDLGLKPMIALQNMCFINGKPSMSTDLLAALAHRHPEWAGYTIKKLTATECTLEVYRMNGKTKTISNFPGSFSMEEARAADLVRPNSPWTKWPKRMLKHRAYAFALRDAFPDAFAGVYTTEEMTPNDFAAEEIRKAMSDDSLFSEALESEKVPEEKEEIKPNKIAPQKKTVAPTRIVKGKQQ